MAHIQRSISVPVLSGLALTGLVALPALAQAPWPQDKVNPGVTVEAMPLQPYQMNMGIAFLSDGRMVLATAGVKGGGEIPAANANSAIWLVSGASGDLSGMSARKLADMLRQPAGVVVVDDQVYFSERDGFYKITSLNPASTSGNRTRLVAWPTPDAGLRWTQGEQWHQWVATPVHHNGKFYGPYGGSIQVGGRSNTPPTSTWSGAFVSWNTDGSGLTKIAGGLRVPNGMTMTPTGQFFTTDNQGSWVPACRFDLIKPNRFYGHRQTPPNAPNWAEGLAYQPPVMWLVDGVHQSASQPVYLTKGPYAGDFLLGDDNSPGLSRIALDDVGGNFNGSLHFFTGGFSNNAINRLAVHPKEDAVIVGTFLAQGDWPDGSAKPLYRVTFKNTQPFEMRSIHSRKGGLEIVLSQPVDAATAVGASFTWSQWRMNRTETYGCCTDPSPYPQAQALQGALQVSTDKRRLFLPLAAATAATDRVVRINAPGLRSATGGSLHHGTAYFSHNYQSQVEFDPTATVSVAPADPSARFLELAVSHSVRPGALSVRVELEGEYTVSLHSLQGEVLASRSARGAGSHAFASPGAPGMKILRVARRGATVIRGVVF